MNLFVHQNIMIHTVRIEAISNSSVFQIGSSGVIKSLSQAYSSGIPAAPAPPAEPVPEDLPELLVPLAEPEI